jgi:hypothetical protein
MRRLGRQESTAGDCGSARQREPNCRRLPASPVAANHVTINDTVYVLFHSIVCCIFGYSLVNVPIGRSSTTVKCGAVSERSTVFSRRFYTFRPHQVTREVVAAQRCHFQRSCL